MRRGNAPTIRTKGRQYNNQPKRGPRPREVEWEATAQRGERPCNSDERQWSGRKMQQPTMGGRGNGGWWSQSRRLMRYNTTTSWGRLEQDATRGGGGGESKLADVRQRCHKRQRGNQSGRTIGKWEAELLVRREVAAHQEAAVLAIFSLWCSPAGKMN